MFKYLIIALALVSLSLTNISCMTGTSAAVEANDSADSIRSPILVELYTSEGCSSCPPADRALAFLAEQQPVSGAEVIALEFHVDYWDTPAWKDPFSSALFSQRQKLYAERYRSDQVYTPQMIVDGGQQFVGSDTLQATNVIMEAAKKAKAVITIAQDKEKLSVKIGPLAKAGDSTIFTVFLAIAEDGLSTDIKGGENSGKKLSHSAVVRELRSLGTLGGGSKGFETQTDLQLQKGWKREDLRAVVFVQENESRRVLAVGQLKLAMEK